MSNDAFTDPIDRLILKLVIETLTTDQKNTLNQKLEQLAESYLAKDNQGKADYVKSYLNK